MKYQNTTENVSVDRTFPVFADLVMIAAYVALADVLVVVLPAESVIRRAVAVPLLCFVPGYVVIAALYPGRADSGAPGSALERGSRWMLGRRAGWRVRGILSVPLSLAIVSVLGVALSLLGLSLASEWVPLAALEAVVVAGLTVALVRRRWLTSDERFRVPYRRPMIRFSKSITSGSWPERALNLTLIALVVASAGGLAYGLTFHSSAERYTTMTLVTENESGEYVASGFPDELASGDEAAVFVNVENHEGASARYSVVPLVQRVETGDGSTEVLEQRELEPIRLSLADGEAAYERHTFDPDMTGTDIRVVYLLYRGGPPEDPTVDSAYRYVHFWTNVSASGDRASEQSLSPESPAGALSPARQEVDDNR